MTMEIPLTQGKTALIDAKDYKLIRNYSWRASKSRRWYAASFEILPDRTRTIYMHRIIMSAKDGQQVDHINKNGLDNRRKNLRICTPSQNNYNRGPVAGTSSQYKGVSWFKPAKLWQVQISANKKYYHGGYFKNEVEAALAYDRLARKLHGEFAYLNFPSEYTG